MVALKFANGIAKGFESEVQARSERIGELCSWADRLVARGHFAGAQLLVGWLGLGASSGSQATLKL
jgi:hypothetical protein